MKRIIRNISILILPFLFMVIVNESVRPTIDGTPYSEFGITAINTGEHKKNKCTWICHHNTQYCKENHVKVLGPYFRFTDPLYFGIINLLQSTGYYRLAKILVFVMVIPFLIWLLLIKSLDYQDKIKQMKKQK